MRMLNDKNIYIVLKSDPTEKTEKELHKALDLLKKSKKISGVTYKLLSSSDRLSPRFYGLPKIHKPRIPLRPISLFVTSPINNLSWCLAWILSPIVGNSVYAVKDFSHFAEFARSETLNSDQVLEKI